MLLLRSLFASLLVLFATAAWAGHITGQVRLDTGQVVDNARVQLRSDMIAYQNETVTNREGRFHFDALPPTTYHLIIEFPGYRPYNGFIDISMSKMSYEGITLQRDRSKDVKEVPPEGPKAAVDARVAQIPDEARSEFQAGQKSLEAKEGPGAIKHFQKAIDLFPNYAEAYQLMGGAYLGSGNLAMAESAFVKAVTIEDRMVNAQLALGLTRNLMGKTREAEQPLQKAVQLDPKNPDAHFELAKNQFALQKFADAEAQASKSLELKPQNPPVYVVLGYSFLRQKKVYQAEEAFRHFLQLAPASPMAGDVRQVEAAIEQHEKQTRQP